MFPPVIIGSPVLWSARLNGGASERSPTQGGRDETLPVSETDNADLGRIARPSCPVQEGLAKPSSVANAVLDARVWLDACDVCFADAAWVRGC